jgi:hypothetical protein
VITTEELLEKISSGSGLENPLPAKVGTTSPTSGGRWVGIVRLRTKATEFGFSLLYYNESDFFMLRKIILRIILWLAPYHSEVFVCNGAGRGIEGEPLFKGAGLRK